MKDVAEHNNMLHPLRLCEGVLIAVSYQISVIGLGTNHNEFWEMIL